MARRSKLACNVGGVSEDDDAGPAITSARFRQVLGHFPTGVTVVTARGPGGEPVGLAVGSFFSVSLEPPLVAFCVDRKSFSFPRIAAAEHFAVNILADDQEDVSRLFASKTEDRFTDVGYKPAPVSGAPLLAGVLAWIDCVIDAVHEGGDHWIVVGRVRDLDVAREGRPLVFYRGGYGRFTSD